MLEPKNLFRVVQDMALSHFEAHDPRSGVISVCPCFKPYLDDLSKTRT